VEHLIELLGTHGIEAVADVRSSPYSQYTPQFNREPLAASLRRHRIHYVFLGEELGARREEPECYESHKVVYRKVARLPVFQDGIARLREGAGKMRVALLCAEKDPLTCHRTVLVSHFARQHFADTLHILEDGRLESQAEADRRLLRDYGLDKEDLFSSYPERLALAYAKRAERIAYTEHPENLLGSH
jgi:uncharacterized protein (DUF488 family)